LPAPGQYIQKEVILSQPNWRLIKNYGSNDTIGYHQQLVRQLWMQEIRGQGDV
jgi:hypothetical protein